MVLSRVLEITELLVLAHVSLILNLEDNFDLSPEILGFGTDILGFGTDIPESKPIISHTIFLSVPKI